MQTSFGTNGRLLRKLRFAVSPLRHQVVFGKQWLACHGAKIDCLTTEIVVKHRDKNPQFIVDEPTESRRVSLSIITKDHRKNIPPLAVILRSNDLAQNVFPEITSLCVRDVLDNYQDVFPKDFPSGLPPKRAHNFHIEHERDTKPPRNGLYRMSLTVLKKLRNQLD